MPNPKTTTRFQAIPGAENPIHFLEELTLNAWPSLQTIYDDGWVLRFADGYTRRANSVQVLYPPSGDLEAHIRRCEDHYRACHLPSIFKMTPLSLPKELDGTLARHRYREEAVTSVQIASLDQLEQPEKATLALTPDLTDDWLNAFVRLRDVKVRDVDTMRWMIGGIAPAKCCAVLYRDQIPAAVGLAVAERGYVGLYDITVHPDMRSQGLGRQLVLYLLHWGKANGAAHAYLQVILDNLPAMRLYEKLGFREVYQYWYRVKT
jgi:ribosomal protein S18 acetylase RimI-like enzyme